MPSAHGSGSAPPHLITLPKTGPCSLARGCARLAEALAVPKPDWVAIFDDKVYDHSRKAGGLRMIGAPKMIRCKIKHSPGDVCPCMREKRLIVDEAIYWPTLMFRGSVTSDVRNSDPAEVALPSDVKALLRLTSVRCRGSPFLTEGWDESFDTPRLAAGSVFAKGHGKGRVAKEHEPTKDERQYARQYKRGNGALREGSVITSDRIRNIIHTVLTYISEHYEHSNFRARRMYASSSTQATCNEIMVTLSGSGAGYCLNMNGTHNSANAYVRIVLEGSDVKCYPRCWCKCDVVRPVYRKVRWAKKGEQTFGGTMCKQSQVPGIDLPNKRWATELFPHLNPMSRSWVSAATEAEDRLKRKHAEAESSAKRHAPSGRSEGGPPSA